MSSISKVRCSRHNRLFFAASGVYYSIYCLFLSYMVTYLTCLGYSALFCGIACTLSYLVGMIVQPLVGYLADHAFPMRKSLIIMTSLAGAGSLALPYTLRYPWLAIVSILYVSACSVPTMYLLDVWVIAAQRQEPTLNYPFIRAGGSLFYGVLSIVMGYIVRGMDVNILFPVQAGLCALLAVLLYLLPDTPVAGSQQPAPTFFKTFRAALEDGAFRFCVTWMLLYNLSHRMMGSYLYLIVDGVGGDTACFGIVTGIGGLAEVAVPLLLGTRIQKCRLDLLLPLCLGLNFIRPLSALLSISLGAAPLVLGQVVQSAGFSVYFTASVTCLSRCLPEARKKTSMSLGMSISNLLGIILANLIGGVLLQFCSLLVLIGSTLLLCAVNMAYLIVKQKKYLSPAAMQYPA